MPMDPAAMGQGTPPAMAAPTEPAASANIPTGSGADTGGESMATPEEMAKLNELMDKIEEKYRQTNAAMFAGANQTESFKKDLIVDVFKALQEAGIDITDPESVKQFLDALQESNPDLYELFVTAFNGLVGGGQPGDVPAIEEGQPAEPEPTAQDAPTSPEGVPSNPGLAGMSSPTEMPASSSPAGLENPDQALPGGLAGKFPNLAK